MLAVKEKLFLNGNNKRAFQFAEHLQHKCTGFKNKSCSKHIIWMQSYNGDVTNVLNWFYLPCGLNDSDTCAACHLYASFVIWHALYVELQSPPEACVVQRPNLTLHSLCGKSKCC